MRELDGTDKLVNAEFAKGDAVGLRPVAGRRRALLPCDFIARFLTKQFSAYGDSQLRRFGLQAQPK